MSQQVSQPLRSIFFALAISVSVSIVTLSGACTSEGDDDGFDNSYSNHIELTCNDSVIVDETFTTLESCEAFRDANNFMCGSIELTINC